jgi:hypothetical protein
MRRLRISLRRLLSDFQTNRTGSLPAGTARPAMQDLTMLLFTVVFFGLAFLYVKACQKLR